MAKKSRIQKQRAAKRKQKAQKAQTSQYGQQAQQESSLRYAPQTQLLQDAAQQAEATRDQAIRGSLAAALGIAAAAREGRVTAQNDYGASAIQQAGSQQFTRGQLAPLGPVADVIRAGSENEGQQARQRLQTMALGAMDELSARQGRGAEAANFGIQKALQSYQGDAAKVAQQLENVAGQQGAFAAQRETQLSEDAQKLAATLRGQTLTAKTSRANSRRTARSAARSAATQRRGQDISAQTSRQNAATSAASQAATRAETARHNRAIEAGKTGGGKPKLNTNQQSATVDQISQARDVIRDAQRQGVPIDRVKRSFATGTPNSKGRAGVPKIPALYAQAGYELATQGKIGHGTATRLKQRGVPIHRFPLMTAEQTKRYRQTHRAGTPARASSRTAKASAKVV